LVLRDILKTACNITNVTYKGWVGGRKVRRVERRVGGFTMLVDTGDQVMCTVGQTDGHNSPDYTTNCADVQWDRIGLQATLLMPFNGLTGSIMVLRDLTGLTTGHL